MLSTESVEHRGSPPYVSATTLLNFISRFKDSVPSHIDKSLLNGYSGSVASQVIGALRFLSLINQENEVTELFEKLCAAEGSQQQEQWEAIVYSSYPFLKNGFDLSTATTGTLDKCFKDMGMSGDSLRKCGAFLVHIAKEAGIQVSPHVKTGHRIASKSTKSRARKPKEAKSTKDGSPPPTPPPVTDQNWNKLLADKLPPFDPTWTEEVQIQWFSAFAKIMEMRSK